MAVDSGDPHPQRSGLAAGHRAFRQASPQDPERAARQPHRQITVGLNARAELELAGCGPRVVDQSRAQSTSVLGRDRFLEEYPHMRALPGARDLEGRRHLQFLAGMPEGSGVITLILLVKVDRQQETVVVLQQGVEAEGLFAGQVAAVAAGHAWFFADAFLSFIGAGRCIA